MIALITYCHITNEPKSNTLKQPLFLLLTILCVDWGHLGSSGPGMSLGATVIGWLYWAETSTWLTQMALSWCLLEAASSAGQTDPSTSRDPAWGLGLSQDGGSVLRGRISGVSIPRGQMQKLPVSPQRVRTSMVSLRHNLLKQSQGQTRLRLGKNKLHFSKERVIKKLWPSFLH